MSKQYFVNDRISITIKPMYCSTATSIPTTSTEFTNNWCVPDTGGVRPRIFVNSASMYFNISGDVAFENI